MYVFKNQISGEVGNSNYVGDVVYCDMYVMQRKLCSKVLVIKYIGSFVV